MKERSLETVHLNGDYLPLGEAFVSVEDRGFLLGDGLYEVTPVYRGAPFRLERHLDRMRFGLRELRIDYDAGQVEEVHHRLIRENELEGEALSLVYLQVTRGVAPRSHAFPKGPLAPTVFAYAKAFRRPPREEWEGGCTAITAPDRRGSRVDIKAITLLPNVLAAQAAVDAGVKEVILVRDGAALEGAHHNFFTVFDGVVTTHPPHQILPGITRECVLELCGDLELPVAERAVQVEELAFADEAFLTGTTTEIRPIIEVDGRVVGDGEAGPVARRLYDAFLEAVEQGHGGG